MSLKIMHCQCKLILQFTLTTNKNHQIFHVISRSGAKWNDMAECMVVIG
jgi:hypothetical protein